VKVRPDLLERERLARGATDDQTVDRVLTAAQSVNLPRGESRLASPVDDVLLPTAKMTAGTLRLALREAPIVVVVLLFGFVAAEPWQFFGRLDGVEYAKVLAGFAVVIGVVLTFAIWDELKAASTVPAEPPGPSEYEAPLAAAGFGPPPAGLRAPRRSRGLVGVTQVAYLFLSCLGVGALTGALFVLLGALAVSPDLASSWASRSGETGYHVHVLFDVPFLGSVSEPVSSELLGVCGALGAVAALAFAVELVSSDRLREELLQQRFAPYAAKFRAWARLYHGSAPGEGLGSEKPPPRWSVVRVEEVEAVPSPAGLAWHPLRMELGIGAFGAAGYSADAAGQTVVEPHSETPDGRSHQELYVVLTGSATFTVDGQEVTAPAGTLVFVRDPAVHRAAVADEAGTTVLAVGGPPSFEPAGSEWVVRARPLMGDDPTAARAVLDAGLREVPASPALRYGLALLHASQGDERAALAALRDAIERNGRLRAQAEGEPLLAPLLDRLA
jgi:mannose-6-phosphate isomerase-like protein (cupin superfamily)